MTLQESSSQERQEIVSSPLKGERRFPLRFGEEIGGGEANPDIRQPQGKERWQQLSFPQSLSQREKEIVAEQPHEAEREA
jgi:hypothetical protein